jgi:hypothetical protein
MPIARAARLPTALAQAARPQARSAATFGRPNSIFPTARASGASILRLTMAVPTNIILDGALKQTRTFNIRNGH